MEHILNGQLNWGAVRFCIFWVWRVFRRVLLFSVRLTGYPNRALTKNEKKLRVAQLTEYRDLTVQIKAGLTKEEKQKCKVIAIRKECEEVRLADGYDVPLRIRFADEVELYDELEGTESDWDEYYRIADIALEEELTTNVMELPLEVDPFGVNWFYYRSEDKRPVTCTRPSRVAIRQKRREKAIKKYFGYDWFMYQLVRGDEYRCEERQYVFDRTGRKALYFDKVRGNWFVKPPVLIADVGEIRFPPTYWEIFKSSRLSRRVCADGLVFRVLFGLPVAWVWLYTNPGVLWIIGILTFTFWSFLFSIDLFRYSGESDEFNFDESFLEARDLRLQRDKYLVETSHPVLREYVASWVKVVKLYETYDEKNPKLNVRTLYDDIFSEMDIVFFRIYKDDRFQKLKGQVYEKYVVEPIREAVRYDSFFERMARYCVVYLIYVWWKWHYEWKGKLLSIKEWGFWVAGIIWFGWLVVKCAHCSVKIKWTRSILSAIRIFFGV
jgi:hypothetical protein